MVLVDVGAVPVSAARHEGKKPMKKARRRRKHGPAATKLRGSAMTGGMARQRGAIAMERKKKKEMAERGRACERLPLLLLPLFIASCGEAEEARRRGDVGLTAPTPPRPAIIAP